MSTDVPKVQIGVFHSSAEIYSWGTEIEASNLGHGATSVLRNTDTGHTAIALKFSADDRGKALINKYCEQTGIPFVKKTVSLMKSPPESGVAYQAEYYEVYFSWWPAHADVIDIPSSSKKAKNFQLHDSLEIDQMHERLTANYQWDDVWHTTDVEIDHRGKRILPPALIVAIPNVQAEILGAEMVNKINNYAKAWNALRRLRNEFYNLNVQKQEKRYKEIRTEIGATIQKMAILKAELDTKQLLSKYMSFGSLPTHHITLPVVDHGNQVDLRLKTEGLVLENMLQKMKDIVEDQKGFNLYAKNCARTSREIIAAGVTDPIARKTFLSESSSLQISTPQSMYKAGRKLSSRLWLRLFPMQREMEDKKEAEEALKDRDNVSRFRKALRKLVAYFKRKNAKIAPNINIEPPSPTVWPPAAH